MKSYEYNRSGGAPASYIDRKRYWWPVAAIFACLPLYSIAHFLLVEREWVLWMPLLVAYVLLPMADHLLGEDRSDPPEAVVGEMESDRWYRYLTWFIVPLHVLTLVLAAVFVATTDLGASGYFAVALSTGLASGLAINTGHELGHKKTRIERRLAQIVLAVPAYGHFTMEHTVGHHGAVATPEDSASARYGENIYRFALREVPGGLLRGWRLERERLLRRGLSPLSVHNEILQSYALSVLLYGALVFWLGPIVLPFLLIHILFAWWQLSSANYIEHYGLLRARTKSGRYERCTAQHSWNANHLISNLLLFQLERHSDHHARPARRYHCLRSCPHAPQLPSGYFGMWLLAYLPWLWRRVMDPRVIAQAGGDPGRINVSPAARERLLRECASSQHTIPAGTTAAP